MALTKAEIDARYRASHRDQIRASAKAYRERPGGREYNTERSREWIRTDKDEPK